MNHVSPIIFNRSKIIAAGLYQELKSIRSLPPFEKTRFSLVKNGLALSVINPAYEGVIIITEDKKKQRHVNFAPRKKNAKYLRTSYTYFDLFTHLLGEHHENNG